jgi:hypothetical protein
MSGKERRSGGNKADGEGVSKDDNDGVRRLR